MTDPQTPEPVAKGNVFSRLYHGETNVDIVGRWKVWFAVSGVFILVGLAALFTRGLNLGIDFTGGTVWQVPAGTANVADVETAVRDLGYDDVQVQEATESVGGGTTRILRVEAEATASPTAATTEALDQARSDLEAISGEVKGGSQQKVQQVLGQLDGIEGPFETDVPDELAALQTQIDDLSSGLESDSTDDKTELVTTSTDTMITQVDALAVAEQAHREEVGRAVSEVLAEQTGEEITAVTVDTVGPSWGEQISSKARTALIVFLLAITLYITLRFEFRMAVATVAALIHDLLIVVGIYALFQFPVTPATVIALLTILGFSIYDGIVVFDRVDENTKLLGRKSKMTYSEMANLSMNQVLMRSLNTSITALLPIFTVLILGSFILGATTLEEFGLALFLGLLSGAYSSIFIATPMLALLKEREPRYRELRERLAQRGSAASTDDDDGDGLVGVGAPAAAGATAAVSDDIAPRPRKQGKKR